MQTFFNCEEKDLPGGLGWSDEKVTAITHAGTHLDAPYHFYPTSEGRPAQTIDQIPLEWCYRDGVVLDFRGKPDGYGITAADIEAELKRIKYKIKPFDIAMIETGTDKHWGDPEYFLKGAGMTRESTLCLIGKGVKIMGDPRSKWYLEWFTVLVFEPGNLLVYESSGKINKTNIYRTSREDTSGDLWGYWLDAGRPSTTSRDANFAPLNRVTPEQWENLMFRQAGDCMHEDDIENCDSRDLAENK
jgi:hypothetical protein